MPSPPYCLKLSIALLYRYLGKKAAFEITELDKVFTGML